MPVDSPKLLPAVPVRSVLGMLALALATLFLAWVIRDRHRLQNPGPASYQATLYSLHVRAVDAADGQALDFRLGWARDAISPFTKGSGPGSHEIRKDRSHALHLVGIPLSGGLEVTISADGYKDQVIRLPGKRSGLETWNPEKILTVKMESGPGKR